MGLAEIIKTISKDSSIAKKLGMNLSNKTLLSTKKRDVKFYVKTNSSSFKAAAEAYRNIVGVEPIDEEDFIHTSIEFLSEMADESVYATDYIRDKFGRVKQVTYYFRHIKGAVFSVDIYFVDSLREVYKISIPSRVIRPGVEFKALGASMENAAKYIETPNGEEWEDAADRDVRRVGRFSFDEFGTLVATVFGVIGI